MTSNRKVLTFESLRYGETQKQLVSDGLSECVLSQSRFNVGVDRFVRVNPQGVSRAVANNPLIRVYRTKLHRGDGMKIAKDDIARKEDLKTIGGVNINRIGTRRLRRSSRQ